jgi:D-alanyl-D-alanine dipeptidase
MLRPHHSLRARPVPETSPVLQEPLAPTGPAEGLNHEDLRDAAAFGLAGRNHYAHARNPPYWAAAPGAIDRLLLRESVGDRLAAADRRLKTEGLQLFLYDAWRPRAVQAYFHDVWTPQMLRARHPELSEAEIAARVGQYWSAPTRDPHRPAPHETGAAVDLTIVCAESGPLWMGGVFDDPSAVSHTRRFEVAAAPDSLSDAEAQANRRLLYWIMTEAGFVNYANEWWHYSWGDRSWAAAIGAPAALYGLAAPAGL